MAAKSVAAEQWAKRVARWEASGLTGREFSAKIGVNHQTLSHWKYELRRRAKEDGGTPAPKRKRRRQAAAVKLPTFVELTPTAETGSSAIDIVTQDGAVVRVRKGFDQELLRQVLEALRGAR